MDILRRYFTDVIDNQTKYHDLVKNYMIITTNNKTSDDHFIICCPKQLSKSQTIKLNSQTLIRLQAYHKLGDMVHNELIRDTDQRVKKIHQGMLRASQQLSEDRIFFNFDPYGNFLLTNRSTDQDIRDLIRRTTTYVDDPIKTDMIDLSNRDNPYGLEAVVFTGGGTKGCIYIGALMGMFMVGSLFYLNSFSGTSIGALTAMIISAITPSKSEFDQIRNLTIRQINQDHVNMIERYKKAIDLVFSRTVLRTIDTFYDQPSLTIYGIYTMLERIARENGLYDPVKSGFHVWYALLIKKICHIMGNGLDKLIVVRRKDGTIVDFSQDTKNITTSYGVLDVPVKILVSAKSTVDDVVQRSVDLVTQNQSLIDTNTQKQNLVETDTQKQSNLEKEESDTKTTDVQSNLIDGFDWDKDRFEGWVVERFFTFKEYNELTDKSLVLTGTSTDKIQVVYYTHTDPKYADLSVLTGASASMSIPYVFKAPIIRNSYHLDGGLFDNYPLTHMDIMKKGRILSYNNKIFGYLIDDQNSIIDSYEIIREMWLTYNGFLDVMNISYLIDSADYMEIAQLFFEIRSELYKFLYNSDTDILTFVGTNKSEQIKRFNIMDMEEMFTHISQHVICNKDLEKLVLPKKGTEYFKNMLMGLYKEQKVRRQAIIASRYSRDREPIPVYSSISNLFGLTSTHYTNQSNHTNQSNQSNHTNQSNQSNQDTVISENAIPDDAIEELVQKVGRKTDLTDLTELAVRQSHIYAEIVRHIDNDLQVIDLIKDTEQVGVVQRYRELLEHVMQRVICYYEIKGTFITNGELDQPSKYLMRTVQQLNQMMSKLNEITDKAVEQINIANQKTGKPKISNYIKQSINIGLMMISKILTRGSDFDLSEKPMDQNKSTYQKAVDYFFHTDMSGILYKYLCIANDRICNDTQNNMRTIKLNSFETSTLHYNMEDSLTGRLIYEGYVKTIRYFTSLLHIMEITGKSRSNVEHLDSYEIRFKRKI